MGDRICIYNCWQSQPYRIQKRDDNICYRAFKNARSCCGNTNVLAEAMRCGKILVNDRGEMFGKELWDKELSSVQSGSFTSSGMVRLSHPFAPQRFCSSALFCSSILLNHAFSPSISCSRCLASASHRAFAFSSVSCW